MKDVPRPALVLGALSVAPFVVFAIVGWLPLDRALRLGAAWAVVPYGAIALAALGGVQWGLAIAGGSKKSGVPWAPLIWSLIAGGLAFVLLWQAPPRVAMIGLVVGHAAAFFADLSVAKAGLAPDWYPKLRKPLAIIAILALASAIFVR